MAMSLALAGLRIPGVEIEDPMCVKKTFPGYWQALADLAKFPTSFVPPG
jgi:3-phosphoshikimate 1-carboxyvinyltransferase